jgi:hypothetical protein
MHGFFNVNRQAMVSLLVKMRHHLQIESCYFQLLGVKIAQVK